MDGTTWKTVTLNGSSGKEIHGLGGVALDAGNLYLSVSGSSAEAGVYLVGEDAKAQRIATAASGRQVFADVALSGGRLYFTERRAALPAADDVRLYSRTVLRSSDGKLTGSAPDRLRSQDQLPSRLIPVHH